MKQFEDRAWEEMKKKLDVALPVRKNRINILWWLALPFILFVTAATFYLNGSQPLEDKNKVRSSIAAVAKDNNTVSKTSLDAQFDENALDNVPKKVSGKALPVKSNRAIGDRSYENDRHSYVAPAMKSEKRLNRINDDRQNDLYPTIVKTAIDPEKMGSQMPDGDNVKLESSLIVNSVPKTDIINESNNINFQERQSIVSADLLVINSLNAGFLLTDLPGPVGNEYKKIGKKLHNTRPFSMSINVNGYTATNFKYSGLNLRPELSLRIAPRSSVFVGLSSRIRITKEQVLITEYNNKAIEYLDVNNLTTSSLDQISISKSNINSRSFDFAADLGYRYRLSENLSLGVSGFIRKNNVFNDQPIDNLQNVGSGVSYYEAKSKISSTVKNSTRLFDLGAGIELKYLVGRRSSFSAGFSSALNQTNSYEMSLGYGFRIF